MRRLLLIVGLILAWNVNAQVVSVECPRSYPPKDSPLDVPMPGYRGRGLVPGGGLLTDWSIFDGEFGGLGQIHVGEVVKVKGGTDTTVPPVRWLVCYYRGDVSWWGETGADKAADAGSIKRGCVVQARDKGRAVKLVCR